MTKNGQKWVKNGSKMVKKRHFWPFFDSKIGPKKDKFTKKGEK